MLVPATLSFAALVLGASLAERDLAALVDGVESIASPGVPGSVCAFGPDAVALVVDRDGVPVVAAARVRRARVVVFGHGGYLGVEAFAAQDTGRLFENALRWAGDDERPRVACTDARVAAWLAERGFEVATDAARADVLVRDLGVPFQAADLDALAEAVEGGTGLVCAATGWGWCQLNPGRTLAVDFDGNLLLARFGLALGGETTKDSATDRFDVRPVPALAHAGHAWRALEQGTLDGAEARAAEARVLAAMGCLAPDEPLLMTPIAKALQKIEARWKREPTLGKERLDRLLVRHLHGRWSALPPGEVEASPTAKGFPGAVPRAAERATTRVTLAATTVGWHATGLFAPPGETLRVRRVAGRLPEGARVRIGCHADRLWTKETWERWPEISLSVPFEGDALSVASPHGGLVYLELERAAVAPLELELEGAVRAPRFVLASDDPAQWDGALAAAPAPWGEIEGRHVILSLPRAALERTEDPAAVATYWDRIYAAHAELGGCPLAERPERIVADVQISAGYMHSGYPIMTHLDGADLAVDLGRLTSEGSWGHFHELGHNAQRTDWTFGGTGEVTCNLFTLYALETVCGIPTGDHPRALDGREQAKRYLAAGGDFDEWKREPFLALAMYVELQQAFGWKLFKDVFREYLALKAAERPADDAAKRDQWCVRLSRRAGRNLAPFFERWAVPVGAAAAASVADLAPWDGR